jgi:hypothetical protein
VGSNREESDYEVDPIILGMGSNSLFYACGRDRGDESDEESDCEVDPNREESDEESDYEVGPNRVSEYCSLTLAGSLYYFCGPHWDYW